MITGASSGMGRETAVQLADRFGGLNEIWLVARRLHRLEELEKSLPVPVRKFALDLTDEEQRARLLEALCRLRPDVKILVNASGYGKIGRVGTLDMGEEIGMPDLNCTALCAVTHMVLPYMSKNSRILQYASSAAFLPQPGFAVYAATKAFVLSYSRALHEELRGRQITVTAVCPGPVKTEFFEVAEAAGKIPVYKLLSMADSRKVVRLAIRDSCMGKTVSVYGPLMKTFRFLCKVLPHSLLLKLMAAWSPEQVQKGRTESRSDQSKALQKKK